MTGDAKRVLRAALSFARHGIPTLACVPNGKRPAVAGGVRDATTDPAEIERWFRQGRRPNIAVATGLRSGRVVIDIDMKHGVDGRVTLAEFERRLGPLPPTLTSSTPGGGEHRWFAMPSGARIRNAVGRIGREAAPGIDVRATGGYVLVPPSAIDGRAYGWRNDLAPAELPPRWVERLSASTAAGPDAPRLAGGAPLGGGRCRRPSGLRQWSIRALQCEARALAATGPGQRNDRLWRAAAALGGLVHLGGIAADEVRDALRWACSEWRERDARKDADTLERGLAWGLANPRLFTIREDDSAA